MGHMTGSIMLQYTPNGTELSKQAFELLIKLVNGRTQNPNYAFLNTVMNKYSLEFVMVGFEPFFI